MIIIRDGKTSTLISIERVCLQRFTGDRTPHPRNYHKYTPKYSLRCQLPLLKYSLIPQQSPARAPSSIILDSIKKLLTFYSNHPLDAKSPCRNEHARSYIWYRISDSMITRRQKPQRESQSSLRRWDSFCSSRI